MRSFIVLLFALGGGLCLSGIVASTYRMLAKKPATRTANIMYCAVMVVAGPSVLLENATRSFRTKACSGTAYGFALAIVGYWAFALGTMCLAIYVKL